MWPFTSEPPPGGFLQNPRTLHEIEQLERIPEKFAPTNPEQQLSWTGWPHQRLTIPVALRIPILTAGSVFIGFGMGSTIGATKASYRYRAENAHRMPTTKSGWYLYQKSKNYHAIVGGSKEGVKFGGVLLGWSVLFTLTEETVDQARMRLFAKGDEEFNYGQRDVLSTVVAGMSTVGFYNWKRRLDAFTAARTAKISLKWSIIYGLFQDASASLRGERPAYVEWTMNKIFGTPTTSDPA